MSYRPLAHYSGGKLTFTRASQRLRVRVCWLTGLWYHCRPAQRRKTGIGYACVLALDWWHHLLRRTSRRGAKKMAEPHPWQPDAAPFVAQLLKHLDAGTLPSEVNPLPHVARGRGHGAARDASTLYAPHVLE